MADNKLDIKAFLDKDEQKDLLRLLTAGSVDDGKSTLIGRLLFDSKKLYEDQLDALERDSKRVGNAGEHIDYALLLDGLKAEREQGITCVVAGDIRNIRKGKDLGHRTNQKFHNLPYNRLYSMMEYKLKMYGIRFVRQEESYTSQCSPLSPEVEK